MDNLSLSERQEKVRKKILAYKEKNMSEERIEYYAKGENTKAVRDKLIKIIHYNYILQLMGDEGFDEEEMDVIYDIAEEKISKVNDNNIQRTDAIKISLIDKHSSTWNIEHFHYEKAIKTLCMMMVTLMDYIIQEQGGTSILYNGLDKTKYFSLPNEINSLNEEYRREYFYICAFDFCTKKLSEYLKISEYKDIVREHNRIVNNGNPERVTNIISRLKEICGEAKREVIIDIEKAYTPEPSYSEDIFEICYQKVIEQYDTEEMAIYNFTELVYEVSIAYTRLTDA